ncbi:MAG: hypothetical protein JO033_16880, partial [Acidobacteriaceae bacterium]|nr:hypothetical protein [Acidobacteriaceae bacterium]
MSQGRAARNRGQYSDAVQFFQRASDLAAASGDDARHAEALIAASASQARLFQYAAAMRSATAAKNFAIRSHNVGFEGAAANNLSAIYSRLGDSQSAEKEAFEAVACFKQTASHDRLAMALVNEADIEADRATGDGRVGNSDLAKAIALYHEAIAAAQKAHQVSLEATIRDELGTSLLLAGYTQAAEQPFQTALSLAKSAGDQEMVPFVKEHLAELAFHRKQYDLALKLVDEAFSTAGLSFKTNPQYYPVHVRGEILLALNRRTEALSQFRKAVESANEWRKGALPGDATNTRTVVTLQAVYVDFALLAAKLSLESHNPALAQEGLNALAENRGASLREQITSELSRDFQLPAAYFELLSQLQSVQAQETLGQSSQKTADQLRDIRTQLSDIENRADLNLQNTPQHSERNPHKNSLRDIQARIDGDEALLSFCLGSSDSFLWAVTGDKVQVYELAGAKNIASTIASFREALQAG